MFNDVVSVIILEWPGETERNTAGTQLREGYPRPGASMMHTERLKRIGFMAGSGGDFEFDDQMQQVPSNVLLADLIGTFSAEVRQFSNGSQVSLNSPFGFPCQPQVIDHLLEEFSVEVR